MLTLGNAFARGTSASYYGNAHAGSWRGNAAAGHHYNTSWKGNTAPWGHNTGWGNSAPWGRNWGGNSAPWLGGRGNWGGYQHQHVSNMFQKMTNKVCC